MIKKKIKNHLLQNIFPEVKVKVNSNINSKINIRLEKKCRLKNVLGRKIEKQNVSEKKIIMNQTAPHTREALAACHYSYSG